MEFQIHVSCQKTNYLKLQNNCIYTLSISRFQLPDILVFIADIGTFIEWEICKILRIASLTL